MTDLDFDQAMQLWFHYETIAMHFNELLIQYRTQLMAALGAIGAISGYLVEGKIKGEIEKIKIRLIISASLLFILIAAFILDYFYYNRLLQLSVKALLELEEIIPEINMSTTIKLGFGEYGASFRILSAYIILAIPIIILLTKSIYEYFKIKKERQINDNKKRDV